MPTIQCGVQQKTMRAGEAALSWRALSWRAWQSLSTQRTWVENVGVILLCLDRVAALSNETRLVSMHL